MKERREHPREQKSFILKYAPQGSEGQMEEVTQLKNISTGGMCFVTEQSLQPGTVLVIELQTPYLTSKVHLEGEVQASQEKAKNLLYETRLKFENLSAEAQVVLEKLMEYLKHEKKDG